MKLQFTALLVSLFSFFIFSNDPARAAAPLTKVIMTSGSVSEREGAIYVAQEHGFFRKYGVDVSFVQVRNGPVGMAALSSGETQFHWGSVSGCPVSRQPFSVWHAVTQAVQPSPHFEASIKSPQRTFEDTASPGARAAVGSAPKL